MYFPPSWRDGCAAPCGKCNHVLVVPGAPQLLQSLFPCLGTAVFQLTCHTMHCTLCCAVGNLHLATEQQIAWITGAVQYTVLYVDILSSAPQLELVLAQIRAG